MIRPIACRREVVVTSAWLAAAMALPILILAHRWLGAAPAGEIGALLLHLSLLPRFAVSLAAGACLGLSGAVLQMVLRNPLAGPTTLGAAAGAQLALSLLALAGPALPFAEKETAAVAGAALATLLSAALAWRGGFSPLALILGGLLVSLLCSTLAAVVGLLNSARMASVLVWSTGTLVQYDWTATRVLLLHLLAGAAAMAVLVRPLTALTLEDDAARSLGVPLRHLRLAALAVGVALAGAVVSAVGVVGFVGLGAPALARLTGCRTPKAQLVWAPPLGGLLLCLTDQAVLATGSWSASLPTGTATALLGAPLLFWLLPRLKDGRPGPAAESQASPLAVRFAHWIAVAVILLLAGLLALGAGQGPDGWTASLGPEAWSVLQWRWPRVLAAAAAGAMLAGAGAILQRLTGNAMASPEVLGVSAGAAMGVILLMLVFGVIGEEGRLAGAAGGATVVLVLMLTLGGRRGYSPQRLLLAGVAITTAFSAIAGLLIASGDPRMQMLLGWMNGSTYQVTAGQAVAAGLACLALLAAGTLIARPLALAPLGGGVGKALGLSAWHRRTSLLLLASLLTAAGSLVVGPLTFVGLMGPHVTRLLGWRGALTQLFASAAFGAAIMIFADWLGRNLLFPYQIPAGLLAALVGCPLVLWSMWRKR